MNERSPANASSRSFAQRLLVAGAALIVLFTVLAPEASGSLSFLPRLCFWSLHIGLGLAIAELCARFLIQRYPALTDWRLVVWSGLIGVVVFAPLAYGLESLFPMASSEPDGEWTDRLAQTSLPAAVFVEMIELAPSYLVAWFLINREGLARQRGPTSDTLESEQLRGFLDRLPPAVGRRVVAVSSDLHYLQVTTQTGDAMVLGSLKEVEAAFGGKGLLVHRSHWVKLDEVRRLTKGGGTWHLEMSNGQRVPISRRKRTVVTEQLGEDFSRSVQETQRA